MYQLLIRLLSPVIIFALIKDAIKRQGGVIFIRQRLGFGYTNQTNSQSDSPIKIIWIHCASVGEVNAALPLIKSLKQRPFRFIITTNTPTGAQFCLQHLSDIQHVYCPVDWPYAIHRFIKTYRPNHLWVVETEIWPNLYQICADSQIEINLINARLSHKTLNAPRWLKHAYKQALNNVSQVLAKSSTDAKRYIELGADENKVTPVGNLKYAQPVNRALQAIVHQPYILLASSHENEEQQIAEIWQTIKADLNRKELLVIVPRHPKRMIDIRKQLSSMDINIAIHSLKQTPNTQTDVFIFDQIGQLNALYLHAQIVIMGGSFIPRGGHNLIEPSAYGKAIITGPHMDNFEDETQTLLAHDALIQCKDVSQIYASLSTLLNDPEASKTLGLNAQDVIKQHQSILADYLQKLLPASVEP